MSSNLIPAPEKDEEFDAWLASMPDWSQVEGKHLDIDDIDDFFKEVAAASIRQMFQSELSKCWARLQEKRPEITYKDIAQRLHLDPALISRRMSGKCNMTLDTIAALFLALESSVVISSHPVEELPPVAICSYVSSVNMMLSQSNMGILHSNITGLPNANYVENGWSTISNSTFSSIDHKRKIIIKKVESLEDEKVLA